MAAARALAFVLAVAAASASAQPPEALDWLRRVQNATQKLSYKGTFVYQQDGRTETSRITRYVDNRGTEIEKLESMDGAPSEIVRTRDAIRCYLPDSKTVKVDRRTPERDFPALLPERVNALARHYDIGLGSVQRVAGFECQEIVLKPRDNLRYGHRLYADTKTGMLLKAVTVDSNGQPIERITFTELSLGKVTRDMTRPRHEAASWRVEDAAAQPATLPGWRMGAELPGFQKVAELKRRLGDARSVNQVVFSDGLAAVSVFIEPMQGSDPVRTGLASMGAIHIYTREVAHHRVTVVGDAPALSVQRIADAVEYKAP
jgi:sigma-E factor negative regulatory protein RseB